jgi:1-deoxy-D-xylulose 5-phosphate reductoisomerase
VYSADEYVAASEESPVDGSAVVAVDGSVLVSDTVESVVEGCTVVSATVELLVEEGSATLSVADDCVSSNVSAVLAVDSEESSATKVADEKATSSDAIIIGS